MLSVRIIVLLLFGAIISPILDPADLLAEGGASEAPLLKPPDESVPSERVTLPNVELVDDQARPHRLDHLLAGRTVVIGFVFTSCKSSCSILSAIMAQVETAVREHLGDELLLVSLTVDPAHDTPEALHAYAERFATTPYWYWLTGSVPDVAQALQAFRIPTTGRPDDHPPVIMAGNTRTGHWHRWVGIPDPVLVAQTAEALMHE